MKRDNIVENILKNEETRQITISKINDDMLDIDNNINKYIKLLFDIIENGRDNIDYLYLKDIKYKLNNLHNDRNECNEILFDLCDNISSEINNISENYDNIISAYQKRLRVDAKKWKILPITDFKTVNAFNNYIKSHYDRNAIDNYSKVDIEKLSILDALKYKKIKVNYDDIIFMETLKLYNAEFACKTTRCKNIINVNGIDVDDIINKADNINYKCSCCNDKIKQLKVEQSSGTYCTDQIKIDNARVQILKARHKSQPKKKEYKILTDEEKLERKKKRVNDKFYKDVQSANDAIWSSENVRVYGQGRTEHWEDKNGF